MQEIRTFNKDCPNKEDQDDKKREDLKKKWEEKRLYSFIRNIYQEMDNNEKEEFMKQAEEAGFWRGELDQCQSLLSSISTL